ncbi:MAG TPA: hypothetical protein ENH94_05800 [Phycisphaerales bacterium]|nr:hypothetical protein [Phycisphaerales bacterium]
MRKYKWIVLVLVCLAGYVSFAEEAETEEAEPKLIGDINSGSKAGEVHVLKLYNDEGMIVHPQADPIPPISLGHTCGVCHDYGTIIDGWHFNQRGVALNDEDETVQIDPGRKGEPWIYWDAQAAVQIPLSYRGWEGTFRPEQIGLSDWEFTKIFGRHMSGGGVGVRDKNTVEGVNDRWEVSGDYGVNCLSCHDAETGHNQSECAQQVGKGNFKWAATGSSAFATVEGNASKLPPSWAAGDENPNVPKVSLDAGRFWSGRKLFVDLKKEVPAQRCYFCHSNKNIGGHMDDDVHMKAGLTCVDCHTNGTDHMIVRGYEGEKGTAAATCSGCHLGVKDGDKSTAGRLGAPYPKHAGIPTVHFKKLSCTSCHSGPWPDEKTSYVKTSRAHALGTHSVNASDETLPHIQWPVFVRGADGKITPSKLMWPAYWGVLKDDAVTPLAPKVVKGIAEGILPYEKEMSDNGNWLKMSDETVVKVLGALIDKGFDGELVYIAGGKMRRVSGGKLAASEHDAAKPYTWPMGHNVRPASQSLGVRSCKDCHSTEAGFMFGKIAVDSPLSSDDGVVMEIAELQDVNANHMRLFAKTFVFRPMMKIVGIAASILIGSVLVLYGLKGLDRLIKMISSKKE